MKAFVGGLGSSSHPRCLQWSVHEGDWLGASRSIKIYKALPACWANSELTASVVACYVHYSGVLGADLWYCPQVKLKFNACREDHQDHVSELFFIISKTSQHFLCVPVLFDVQQTSPLKLFVTMPDQKEEQKSTMSRNLMRSGTRNLTLFPKIHVGLSQKDQKHKNH